MIVKDVMTKNVKTVEPETKITEVAEIIFRNRFHGVPVVKNSKIAGIITESDFFTKDAKLVFLPSYIDFLRSSNVVRELSKEKQAKIDRLMNIEAKDIMTTECVTVMQNMKVEDLINFFKETKFITIPVVDERDQLVGIVTLTDIIGLMRV